MKVNKEILNDIFTSILANYDKETIEFYKKIWSDSLKEVDFTNPETIDFQLFRPLFEFINGYIKYNITNSNDYIFIIWNYEFIKNQFREKIKKVEGSCCVVDKTVWIIRRLLEYFITGKEIIIPEKEEYYTPKETFKNHQEIIDFYNKIKELYYGKIEC